MPPRLLHLINALNECTAACNECLRDCLTDSAGINLERTVQLTRDCADLSQFVASFIGRGSEHVRYLLLECANLCRDCADEVTQYSTAYSRQCTEACRQAEDACRTAY